MFFNQSVRLSGTERERERASERVRMRMRRMQTTIRMSGEKPPSSNHQYTKQITNERTNESKGKEREETIPTSHQQKKHPKTPHRKKTGQSI